MKINKAITWEKKKSTIYVKKKCILKHVISKRSLSASKNMLSHELLC